MTRTLYDEMAHFNDVDPAAATFLLLIVRAGVSLEDSAAAI